MYCSEINIRTSFVLVPELQLSETLPHELFLKVPAFASQVRAPMIQLVIKWQQRLGRRTSRRCMHMQIYASIGEVLETFYSSVGCTLPFRHFCTNSRTFFHAFRVKKRIRCPKDKCRTGAVTSSCLAFAKITESKPTLRICNTAHDE